MREHIRPGLEKAKDLSGTVSRDPELTDQGDNSLLFFSGWER